MISAISATRNLSYDFRKDDVPQTDLTTWLTPDACGTPDSLRDALCDLGQESDGSACGSCPAQCAFGRAYLLVPQSARPRRTARPPRGETYDAFDKSWNPVRQGLTIDEARAFAGQKSRSAIHRSARNPGKPAGGYYWKRSGKDRQLKPPAGSTQLSQNTG